MFPFGKKNDDNHKKINKQVRKILKKNKKVAAVRHGIHFRLNDFYHKIIDTVQDQKEEEEEVRARGVVVVSIVLVSIYGRIPWVGCTITRSGPPPEYRP